MIRFLIIFMISVLVFSSSIGQINNLILTSEQNNSWFDSLKIQSLDRQLFTIKYRLLADTNIFVKRSYPDRIRVVEQVSNRVIGEGKPTIIIGGLVMFIDNKTETKKVISLTELLDTTSIKAISILSNNDPATIALFGDPGHNGVIIMTLTKKRYLKKFKRLKLKPNY